MSKEHYKAARAHRAWGRSGSLQPRALYSTAALSEAGAHALTDATPGLHDHIDHHQRKDHQIDASHQDDPVDSRHGLGRHVYVHAFGGRGGEPLHLSALWTQESRADQEGDGPT